MSLEPQAHGQGSDIAISSFIESETTDCAKYGWIEGVVENLECFRVGLRNH